MPASAKGKAAARVAAGAAVGLVLGLAVGRGIAPTKTVTETVVTVKTRGQVPTYIPLPAVTMRVGQRVRVSLPYPDRVSVVEVVAQERADVAVHGRTVELVGDARGHVTAAVYGLDVYQRTVAVSKLDITIR